LDAVTPSTPLLIRPPLSPEQAWAYYQGRVTGGYSPEDVKHILVQYLTLAPSVGMDPLIPIAQMSLETGHLTSFWSQRPRRNPAGVGVTGVPGAGVSFPSWVASTRAHVGRLLAYALPLGTGTTEQRRLISEALSYRPLPDAKRGTGANLLGLARSWAADPAYAGKVSRVANAVLGA
jgi:hypothetical protein